MQLLFHLFGLSRILSLSFANDYFIHRHLQSRQLPGLCLPIVLEYPNLADGQCPDNSLYVVEPGCTCCQGATNGCYTSTDVCSVDASGNSICCPSDPACSEGVGNAATTAPPSSPTTTATQPDAVPTPASSQNTPPSSSTTASDNPGPPTARVSSGASRSRLVELESLVMITLLGLI